ncbi:unnamed protein product [Phytomonas sp. EM1]|nr:unnamed protein product [Phytomonas sp. EM1]|eukprot:CCW65372.1 unnamed protein product [Phytomonas sp. isolate EM1]
MGQSAKITRGGNKKRINQGRLQAKMKAQGAKMHTTLIKESVDAKLLLKRRAQMISDELKAKSSANSQQQQDQPTSIVRMVPKPRPNSTSMPPTGASTVQHTAK